MLVLGRLPVLLLNLGLPLAAGTFASLGEYLRRPLEFERLEAELEHLRILRERVMRDLPDGHPDKSPATARLAHSAVLNTLFVTCLVAVLATGTTRAAGVCAVFADESDSVGRADRWAALDFVEGTLFDYASAFDCSIVLVGRFSDQGRFAPRTRIPLPERNETTDCESTTPEPLRGSEALYGWLTNVRVSRENTAITECREEAAQARESYDEEVRTFLAEFRTAVVVETPRADVRSHIRRFLESVVAHNRLNALILVTDGIENPPESIDGLAIDGPAVVMIVAAPNPRYATLDEVMRAADAWAAVPGLTVTTTHELHPSLWSDVATEHGGERALAYSVVDRR